MKTLAPFHYSFLDFLDQNAAGLLTCVVIAVIVAWVYAEKAP